MSVQCVSYLVYIHTYIRRLQLGLNTKALKSLIARGPIYISSYLLPRLSGHPSRELFVVSEHSNSVFLLEKNGQN